MMGFLANTTHMHITAWVIALVLFFVCAMASKPNKVMHMILRVMYILLIITGGALVMKWRSDFGMIYDIKALFGILVIVFMELTLVKKQKGKPASVFLVLTLISIIATIFIGVTNGIGMNF